MIDDPYAVNVWDSLYTYHNESFHLTIGHAKNALRH